MYIMAQSDFIARKRTKAQLIYPSKLPNILDSRDYTAFKQFGIGTAAALPTIDYAKQTTFRKLIPPNHYRVSDLDVEVNPECPVPFGCIHTNMRQNRVPMKTPMFSVDLRNIYKQTNEANPCRQVTTNQTLIRTTLTDTRFNRIDTCMSE